jgi:hypothetical protein
MTDIALLGMWLIEMGKFWSLPKGKCAKEARYFFS